MSTDHWLLGIAVLVTVGFALLIRTGLDDVLTPAAAHQALDRVDARLRISLADLLCRLPDHQLVRVWIDRQDQSHAVLDVVAQQVLAAPSLSDL